MQGFDPSRFETQVADHLNCPGCKKIVRDPYECTSCGQLYCQPCTKVCVNGCTVTPNQYSKIGGAMLRLYNNLQVKCSNPECTRTLNLMDLDSHEKVCLKLKCLNFAFCQDWVNMQEPFKSHKCCGPICQITNELADSMNDFKKQHLILNEFMKQLVNLQHIPKGIDQQNVVAQQQSGFPFKWDNQKCGQGIQFSRGDMTVFLKESAYMFRTVLSDIPFMNGIHYWEIEADASTENELKIGVCHTNTINLNAAFCDVSNGFAYYGLAQLRNGSNASGATFGKRFKKEGVLGVCLNMNAGTLSFALNNESMGVAFRNESLKKGPLYAAVALLHCAGCTLRSGIPKPNHME